jgi:hypothetical protein
MHRLLATAISAVVLALLWFVAYEGAYDAQGISRSVEIPSLDALGVPDSQAMPFPTLRRSARREIRKDVTAILLNWNRLDSLVRVVEHLCRYDDIFAYVLVWNNNPDIALTREVV